MTWVRENGRFILNFLKHPKAVGAIMPSSKHLAARMIKGMGLRHAKTVVEIGPGTGAVTTAIAKAISPGTFFLAVELDGTFAASLAERFPGVRVINDSAEHLGRHLERLGRSTADSILCSLPWAGFPRDLQERILRAIAAALRPGGRFSTYAYVHAAWFPAARRFREALRSHFRSVRRTKVVWRNVPPAIVYRCEK